MHKTRLKESNGKSFFLCSSVSPSSYFIAYDLLIGHSMKSTNFLFQKSFGDGGTFYKPWIQRKKSKRIESFSRDLGII